MKVLFLDIDGVLNTGRFIAANRESDARIFAGRASDEWWLSMIDPTAADRIRRIIIATGCVVVVSSSWRLMMGLGQLRRILAAHSIVPTWR